MKTLTILLCLCTAICFAQDPVIGLQSLETGFTKPIDIQNAGDDRLFIVEQDGKIKIIKDGDTNSVPFLDIDARVNSFENEQGLLGLAFHPDYANNGYFYVNYTLPSGATQISRFEVTSDPDIADESSEFRILSVAQPFGNHNGGCIQFGDDGYLYIGLGDGGSGGDPGNRAQNPGILLGKMLRIDIDNTDGSQNYAIPADNPFVGDSSTLDEIWALGLRNPWKFSFDSETNDLWIGDVGQNEIEEINKVDGPVGGQNYGWRCYEGSDTFNTSGCPDASELVFPVAEYTHTTSGEFKCSITGGYVYRGTVFTGMQGLYIFGDFCSNEIGYVKDDNSITYSTPFNGGISSFGLGNDNELYVAALNTGIIYRVIDENLSTEDFTSSSFSMYPNPATNQVHLDFPDFLSIGEAGAKEVSLNIYDISGRKIQSEIITTANSTFSVAELPSGIYLAQIENSGQTQKLIVR